MTLRISENLDHDMIQLSGKDLEVARSHLLESLHSSNSFDDLMGVFFGPIPEAYGLTRPHANVLVGLGLELTGVRLQDENDRYLDRFSFLNQLNLTSAPRYLEPIRAGSRSAVIVQEWPGIDPSELLDYNPELVTEEASQRFLSEMSRLADYGVEHPYVTSGFAHWKINPATQSIVLTGWENLTIMDEGTREAHISTIRDMLANKEPW